MTVYIYTLIVALVISILAQVKVFTMIGKYKKIKILKQITGVQVTRTMLNSVKLTDIRIELNQRESSNHYDHAGRVIRLSEEIYNGDSITAIGVSAHEVGHAIQDSTGYKPIRVRNIMVPILNIFSAISWVLFLVGLIFSLVGIGSVFIKLGVVLFSSVVLFQILTLPIEVNANKNAIATLREIGILSSNEEWLIENVLKAVALKYVALSLVAIIDLIKKVRISDTE